ncbi:hypothetical protein HZA38_02685 [Candidatus Peregrinibacteria bacterium]|nr:hypothetical protein [Candidatus Peregrinibacteria bacterium]
MKDITQDILRIPTPLNSLGNIQEDFSQFPNWFEWFFFLLGTVSFLVEIFIIIAIPLILIKKKTDFIKYIVGSVCFLILYFLCAALFDPKIFSF